MAGAYPRRSANGRSLARKIDEFAPLIDSMLRAEVLLKASVIHERLTAEYGFTGNYQRVKLYARKPGPGSPRNSASPRRNWRACTAGSR
ncbi:hypothetical protein ACWD0A_33885 [Streptomyces sp. NPDC002867]